MSESDRNVPVFVWEAPCWTSRIKLPFWKTHLSKGSRGFIDLEVVPPGADETEEPPSEEQRAAIAMLVEHDAKLGAAVLKALLKQYGAAQARSRTAEPAMKPLKDASGLRKHVTLNRIYVLAMAKQKRAYVGFSFGCSWDPEHGAGVMTHKTRVVAVGGADHAFLWWIPKRDGGIRLEAPTPAKPKTKGARRR